VRSNHQPRYMTPSPMMTSFICGGSFRSWRAYGVIVHRVRSTSGVAGVW
jgi:hypothetical protein